MENPEISATVATAGEALMDLVTQADYAFYREAWPIGGSRRLKSHRGLRRPGESQ
jgi:hypothetical protein